MVLAIETRISAAPLPVAPLRRQANPEERAMQHRPAEQQQPSSGQPRPPEPQRDADELETRKRGGEPRRHEKERETGQEQNRPKRDKAPPDQPDEPNPSAHSEP